MPRTAIRAKSTDVITDDGSVLVSVAKGEQIHLTFTLGWLSDLTGYTIVAPADVAASLKVQARDIRKMFDEQLGKGIATDADVVARMDLSTAIGGFGNMSRGWLLQPLGVERAFDLGQATGLIPTLYREELGRAPDAEGEAFWTETWTKQFRAGIR